MNLSLKKARLSVCQLASDAPIPIWAMGGGDINSISRMRDELSIICVESAVPKDVKQEAGWRAFKVDGPLDFALTGILASIAVPLANAGVSIFALSTYNTDFVLVKDEKVAEAVKVLKAAGHSVSIE